MNIYEADTLVLQFVEELKGLDEFVNACAEEAS